MPTEITKDQAANLYLSQLQRQSSRLGPNSRIIKRYFVRDPNTGIESFLSIVDLITQVQNRTAIGMKNAIEYTQQLENGKGEPLYIIVG